MGSVGRRAQRFSGATRQSGLRRLVDHFAVGVLRVPPGAEATHNEHAKYFSSRRLTETSAGAGGTLER